MKTIVIGVLICIIVYKTDSQCTFPSDLRGNWISADRGILTFTSNGLTNYPIDLSVSVSSVDFDCDTFQNDQYYLRGTTTFLVFGKTLRAHICMEFQNITSDKYYYFIATDIEPTVNERIYVVEDALTVTHADVCNRQKPFEVGNYIMLIRDGSSDSSLAIECPSDILRTFDTVDIVSTDGTNACYGSQLDTCTDQTTMNFTYNSCPTNLTFSDGGAWRCLYYTISGSTTYLAAWNVDATLVPSQTYQIICYTLQWQDRRLRTTAYPGQCRTDQTSTSVTSPGVIMTMYDVSVNCDLEVFISRRKRDVKTTADPVYGADLVPYYVGAVAFAILLLGCAGVCMNYHHYKNADKPNKVHTIQVKEFDKQQHRESTSGIFSCSSTSLDELDFKSTSTPIPYQRIKQPITTPPSSLTEVLHPQRANRAYHIGHDNIYDDIHYTYIGQGHLRKTEDVQTSEDFYRNYKTYPHKKIPYRYKHSRTAYISTSNVLPISGDNRSNMNYYNAKHNSVNNKSRSSNSNSSNTNHKSGKNNPRRQSGQSKISKSMPADGPLARGRGDITNTVHYFNMRIPLHWR